MEQYLIFLLIILIGITLLIASYSDYKTRKVSVKIWYPSVFIALPIAMFVFGMNIWNGVINVSYSYHSFPIFYSLAFIVLMGCIANSDKFMRMGGADFIAISIITIVFMSIDLYLSLSFFKTFCLFAIITIIASFYYTRKNKLKFTYKIPLIVTISVSYFVTIGLFLIQTNFGTLPFV